MIESFVNYQAANEWMAKHPEWKPIAMSKGILTGHVLVLFEAATFKVQNLPAMSLLHSKPVNPPVEVAEIAPKRRGRPPKK